VAAGAILFLVSVPARTVPVFIARGWTELASRTVAGAYHVHSTRSDGNGDVATIAAAAARAGLKFVIITDHGDGTRSLDRPAYLDGVLCLDAVEISTDDGHYVALDMPPSPYPLGGTASAVVEDVARLGGFGIAAHPDSPKAALRWTDEHLPVDGIEWVNADSEWRDETRTALARAALGYFVRPSEALSELLDRPAALQRWDRWSASRPIVALAGADAHGGIGRGTEEGSAGVLARLGIPSYEAAFRTFSNRVILDRPLTGDPAVDARGVFAAIRRGSVFTVVDALATPGLLDFHRDGSTLVTRVAAPPRAQLVMIHQGTEVARTSGPELRWESGGDGGPYRVEVHLSDAPGTPPVPWLVSNELFTSLAGPKPRIGFEVPWTGSFSAPVPWRIEKEPSSSGELETTSAGATLTYGLGQDRQNSPFVALATDLRGESFSAIEAALSSSRPTRVSIQGRADGTGRWGSSVFVDSSNRLVRIPLSALRSMEHGGPIPPSTSLTSILIVIDSTNTPPGASGRLTVRSLRLVP
jgi:hypothetical protein